MAKQIKVELIKTETIKPSSSTPDHLRSFKLSLLDQIAPFYRTLIILFYPPTNPSVDEKSQVLKNSLSHTLKKFYPFAGRHRDNLWIDCNDAGVELVLARVHSPMSMFLENLNSEEMLKLLVPPNNETSKEAVLASPLLLVRASFFDCGAMSICVCLSHKISDGTSLSSFLNCWATSAAASRRSNGCSENYDSSFTPQFVSSSLFPPAESLATAFTIPTSDETVRVRVKRLVFHGHTIAALRSRLASQSEPNPSRVEAVLAVVWNALINSVNPRSKSVVTPHVNLRKMVSGSFAENYLGNMAWIYISESDPASAGLKELVVSLRKGYEDFKASFKRRTQLEGIRCLMEQFSSFKKSDEPISVYATSSVCRFPWYRVDFGWGEPSLVCLPVLTHKNIVMLLDSKDGDGIDVWLSLSEEDMAAFERTHKLMKSIGSIIPSSM